MQSDQLAISQPNNQNHQQAQQNQQQLLNEFLYAGQNNPAASHNQHGNSISINEQSESAEQGFFSAVEERYALLKIKRKQHVLYFVTNLLVLLAFIGLCTAAILLRNSIIQKDGKVCWQICYPLGNTELTIIVTASCVLLLKFFVSFTGMLAYYKSSTNLITCMKYVYIIQIVPAFVYLDVIELILNGFMFWEAAQLEQIFMELQEVKILMDSQGIEYD